MNSQTHSEIVQPSDILRWSQTFETIYHFVLNLTIRIHVPTKRTVGVQAFMSNYGKDLDSKQYNLRFFKKTLK